MTTGGTALAREFVWGRSYPEPVAMIDRTGESAVAYHYLRDVLGSVVALTDASGAVVERYRYDPYGRTYIYNASGTRIAGSAVGNPWAFTGQPTALPYGHRRRLSPGGRKLEKRGRKRCSHAGTGYDR